MREVEDEHNTRLTLLPSIYGVVERIRGLLSSDAFHEIKSQPSSLLQESDLLAIHTTLSHLHAAFPQIYHKFLTVEGRERFRDVQHDLQRLRRDAYDVEDVLDVAATEQLMKKVKATTDLPKSEQMLLPTHVSDLSCKLRTMHRLLEVIFDGLETYESERGVSLPDKMSTFRPNSPSSFMYASPDFMLNSTEGTSESPMELEDFIVGRDAEKEQLIQSIFHSSNQEHPKMISVYGQAGIGKTALVKLVYNDIRVSTSFDLVLWVSAGFQVYMDSELDMKRLVLEIIRSISQHHSGFHPNEMDRESLKGRLRAVLQGQKYLLVLDDFEFCEVVIWKELMEIFKVGSTGSTIILVGNQRPYPAYTVEDIHLDGLHNFESWSLFTQCAAFSKLEPQEYPFLVETAICIVNKCYGNPLAIKALGSRLRTNRDEHTWKQIDRTLQCLPGRFVALSCSIENMPYDLIQFLLASAILFEYKVAVSKDQLLYFWMAHRLLPSSKGNKDLRDVVDVYCNELLLRGFLQVDHSHYRPNDTFRMHREVLHIAKSIIGKEENGEFIEFHFIQIGRHLLWESDRFPSHRKTSCSKGRTILFKHYTRTPHSEDLGKLISDFPLGRVLLLDRSEFEKLPDALGNLKLLRYLSLEGNHRLQVLPNSICNLVNLQTLDLSGCVQLQKLPGEMHNLVSLRHMLLSLKLTSLPEEALKSWTSLHLLKICYCQHLRSLSEGIQQLTALRVLRIHDCPSISSLPSSIKYLTNLKELSILDCQMLDLTGWEGLDGLICLQFLQFQGLPNLIEFPEGLQSAGDSLRHLVVSNCQYLKVLPECLQKCNNLLEVIINTCPSIVALPKGIRAIKTLKVLKIFNCPELIAKCELGKEDRHLISHIPKIHLFHSPTKGRAAEHPRHADDEPQSSSSQYDNNINVQAGVVKRKLGYKPPSSAIPSTSRDPKIYGFNKEGALPDVEILDIQEPQIVREDEYSMSDASSNNVSQDGPKTMDENELSNDSIMEETRDDSPKYRTLEEISCCSIFFLLPEDYEFQEDALTQLWMALGYIKDELIGQECFHSLLNEGYLIRCGINFMSGRERYQMNIKKMKELLDGQIDNGCFHFKLVNEFQKYTNPTETQHVSLVCNVIDASIFQTLEQFTELRTLLFLRDYGNKVSPIPDHLFQSFKELRALDLSRTNIKKLPSSVGCMIHLCYLDLSGTLIEWLPDLICSLEELQTLKLRGCSKLRGLPRQLKKLTQLRHLDVDVLRQLATIPGGIGALVNLRTLSAFLVSTEDGCKIHELKELNSLTGDFCIAVLENVGNGDEAKEAALNNKQYLNKLELRWTASQLLRTNNNCYDVLKCLQPCSSLKELQIFCYEGFTFPDWVGDPTFNQLVSITFFKCEHVLELPLVEQLPFLKHLELVKMNGVKKIERRGNSEQAAFFRLEKLEVDEMQSLRSWNWTTTNEDDFRSLVELTINDCPGLREIHVLTCLSSIKHLEVRGCPKLESLSETKLPDSLEDLIVEDCPMIKRKCSQQGGEDWKKIQHVSNIRICEDDEDEDDDEC